MGCKGSSKKLAEQHLGLLGHYVGQPDVSMKGFDGSTSSSSWAALKAGMVLRLVYILPSIAEILRNL